MKKIDKTENYFLEEIKQNESNKKHGKVCTTRNYIEYFFILVSIIKGCFSTSAFASLFGVPVGISNSAIGLEICTITAGFKKYKLITKKKKKKHDRTVLLAKSKLNRMVLIFFSLNFEDFTLLKY